MSATARRCSRVACAAILARASSSRHAAQPYQPVELGGGVGVHHDHQVVERGEAVLGQQRDVVDDDRVRARGFLEFGGAAADQRVDDRVERLAALLVGEDDRAEFGAVEVAVGGQDAGPNSATTAASPGVPGSTTSRAIRSASTSTAP